MLKSSWIIFLFCLAAFLPGGCASLPADSKTAETLRPSGVHEDCMELLPGETLNYSFRASRPLDFNIHYHEDHNIFYAVTKASVSTEAGTFLCEKHQYYCLMWTNPGPDAADLLYERSVSKKQ